jgi:hypothetical protein
LHELREPGSGAPWLERAKRGFDTAIQIAPARYRLIAARAWLALGVRTADAFALAEAALSDEPTLDGYVLLLEAARASDRVAEWCRVAAESAFTPDCDERGVPPPSLPRCR